MAAASPDCRSIVLPLVERSVTMVLKSGGRPSRSLLRPRPSAPIKERQSCIKGKRVHNRETRGRVGDKTTMRSRVPQHRHTMINAVPSFPVHDGDCQMVDPFGRTTLHWAAERGQVDKVHALRRAGASIDALTIDKETPLMLAALRGNEEVVRVLLKAGASESDRGHASCDEGFGKRWRRTALHCAAAGGHVRIVSALLAAGFHKQQRDGAGLTAAETSSRAPHATSPATTFHLLPDDRGGKLLYEYVNMVMEDLDIVNGLVRGGAYLEWRDATGETCLHRAAHFGHAKTVTLLLEAGARANLRNCRGGSPLHVAACSGCVGTTMALLGCGVSTELRMLNGRSPLHLAVINNKAGVVNILLRRGAYTEHRDLTRGQTPLSEASEYCLKPIIRMLLDAGADVQSRSRDGGTPLHWACRFSSLDGVEALLTAGADPDAIDGKPAQVPSTGLSLCDLVDHIMPARRRVDDVIGMGDPYQSGGDPQRRFAGETESLAKQWMHPAIKLRIMSTLRRARYDRAWRRRGWLVVLARRWGIGGGAGRARLPDFSCMGMSTNVPRKAREQRIVNRVDFRPEEVESTSVAQDLYVVANFPGLEKFDERTLLSQNARCLDGPSKNGKGEGLPAKDMEILNMARSNEKLLTTPSMKDCAPNGRVREVLLGLIGSLFRVASVEEGVFRKVVGFL